MFEEARDWLLLERHAIAAPVHILQGRADETVPLAHALALVERLTAATCGWI